MIKKCKRGNETNRNNARFFSLTQLLDSNTTVYHIGRVFYKQDEAFKYLDSHFDAKALHVFAFEQVTNSDPKKLTRSQP
jgi:DNA-binding GntR family transcriptional regulator